MHYKIIYTSTWCEVHWILLIPGTWLYCTGTCCWLYYIGTYLVHTYVRAYDNYVFDL